MVKKLLIVALLILSITSISAFCTTQGYLLDSNNQTVNTSKVNIICQRSLGNITAQLRDIKGYGFPFGDWYDDCSYCDLGVHVVAYEDDMNLYGEIVNKTCSLEFRKVCHTNIYLNAISEPVSEKQYYDSVPDVGPYAPEPIPMPKGEETPMTNVKGVKEYFNKGYTVYYIVAGIVMAFVAVLLIRKYAK